MEHVPYRGTAPLVQELIAGRVQLGGDQISTGLIHLRAGTLKALATMGPRRQAVLPDVPTVRELGFPSIEQQGWNGYFAPAGTPPAIVQKLNGAVADTVADPAFKEKMAGLGADTEAVPLEPLMAILRGEDKMIADLAATGLLKTD